MSTPLGIRTSVVKECRDRGTSRCLKDKMIFLQAVCVQSRCSIQARWATDQLFGLNQTLISMSKKKSDMVSRVYRAFREFFSDHNANKILEKGL